MRPPETSLTQADLDAVVRLAYLLQGQSFREPFESISEERRKNMRTGALRVVQALVMLGWIEAPD